MLKNISFFRLQPIVKISNGKVLNYGHEVLVNLSHIKSDELEDYFSNLSLFHYRNLFKLQLSLFSRFDGHFFINAPVEIFLSDFKFDTLFLNAKSNIKNNISIEIQDADVLLTLSDVDLSIVRKKILMLQNHGVNVWLDDADDRFLGVAIYLSVHGIKIDKTIVWSVDDLSYISEAYSNVGVSVLAEGIDSIFHFNKLIPANIYFAQGYFWPEIHLDLHGKLY